jgi:Skp family chaperone for outer membrane proteins
MKPKFLRSLMAAALLIASSALAQTSSSSTAALPAAPGAAADPPPVVAINPNNKGIAAINVEGAIFNTNEGMREMDSLQKKFEPKSNELKAQNDEIEALKKKLNSATAEGKPEIERQIEQKQKVLDRAAQDAREDFQTQQNEIGQKILQKMAPVIMKYANDNGIGMVIDTSQPWPQGPVLLAAAGVDITKPVIDSYNAQSGVAPPPPRSGSSTRPSGTTPRSSAPAKPATTTPPPK